MAAGLAWLVPAGLILIAAAGVPADRAWQTTLAGVAAASLSVLAFFAAPVFGLVWALHLLISRGKRELPYGPWLAVGALVVMLFYDGIVDFIVPGP